MFTVNIHTRYFILVPFSAGSIDEFCPFENGLKLLSDMVGAYDCKLYRLQYQRTQIFFKTETVKSLFRLIKHKKKREKQQAHGPNRSPEKIVLSETRRG